MHSFMYRFAAFAAIIALLGAFLNGVSMPTSMLRAGLVFLGTLVLFIAALSLMRWTVIATTIVEQNHPDDDELETAEKTSVQTTEKQMEAGS